MKKLIAIALGAFVLGVAGVEAQAPAAYPVGPAAMLPQTTVKVRLTVEKEVVTAGPYARYAQRWLGVVAPLADRTSCRILSAKIDYDDPQHVSVSAGETSISSGSGGGFAGLTPDRVSEVEKSTEEMAAEAASTIFALRRQRLDILTAEAGELYPGGLDAVLAEISRMEEMYIALFLGKRSVEVTVQEVEVVPEAGRTSYIACRFSERDGVLPDGDLSGEPVVLSMAPEGAAATGAAGAAPKTGKQQMIQYRVADFAECTLALGQEELARRRIPVYQFGATITAAAL